MSREALHESLSAVMDNEADELELRRVLAASDDAELRAKWSRYQVARAAMHKDLQVPSFDISAAVAAAIEAEEAPVAAPAAEAQAAPAGRWRKGIGRLAVAASVTFAVLAGVKVYNTTEMAGPQVAVQPAAEQLPQGVSVPSAAQGPAVLAGFSENQEQVSPKAIGESSTQSEWHEQRLPAYIRQHAQQAAYSDEEGAVARPIGAEQR